jgi:PASTA domain-containing protein
MPDMRGLVILAAIGACAAAISVTSAPAATPKPCKVPRLTGRTTTAAKAALKAAGCATSVLHTATRCSATANVGKVLDQTPAAKAVLKKGQKVSVHIGAFCQKPPPPPPPAPNFVGDFLGTYTGTLLSSPGCPDIPISGRAEVYVTQQDVSTYDVQFLLENADVSTTEGCQEVQRDNSYGDVEATASGTRLGTSGISMILTANTLNGQIQTSGGQIAFTVTRS